MPYKIKTIRNCISFCQPYSDACICVWLQKYVENVKQDASIGTNILRVSASDEDADNNGAIVYSLTAPVNPNDLEYFEIQAESGWIVLKKPLDVSALVCPFVQFNRLCSQGSLLFSGWFSFIVVSSLLLLPDLFYPAQLIKK